MLRQFHEELLQHIRLKVHSATHGRVHDFHVECTGDQVVLRGKARSHYAKQLAQHATHCIVRDRLLVNAIEVG